MWELVSFMASILAFVIITGLIILAFKVPGLISEKRDKDENSNNRITALEAQLADLKKQFTKLKSQ